MTPLPIDGGGGALDARAEWGRMGLCFLAPAIAAWLLTWVWVPLAWHQAEEYLELARVGDYSLFRPPGYVMFLQAAGWVGGGIDYMDFGAIFAAQSLVFGVAGAAFYVLARKVFAPRPAVLLALAFGFHPLPLVLAGYLRYDMWHLALLVAAAAALAQTFVRVRASRGWAVAAGVLFGVATLTRPMTLLLPPVLALALAAWPMPRPVGVWRAYAVLVLAMVAVIAPRTWSNFARTSLFIPVNAQSGSALWPMTVAPLRPDSINFPWVDLWLNRGAAELAARMGPEGRRDDVFQQHPIEADAAMRAMAAENFARNPWTYFDNVLHNAAFFWTGVPRRLMHQHLYFQQNGQPPEIDAAPLGLYSLGNAGLQIAAAFGFALGLWRRERTLLLAGSVFIALWLAHSLVYLDTRYLYSRLPWLLLFAAFATRLALPERWQWREEAACGVWLVVSLGMLAAFLV